MSHHRNDPDKHSSYMDGIPVKISELYKPPKKITLPVGIANRQPIEKLEEYEFRLERSTAEKMTKLRELRKASVEKRRQRIADEDKKLEELKKATTEEAKATADSTKTTPAQSPESIPAKETEKPASSLTGALYVIPSSSCVTENNMLTPVPVNQPDTHQQDNNYFDPIKSGINISDFESDSSPFDNMELKTLNDIAELASVLQPNNEIGSRTHQNYQTYNQQSTDNQSLYNQPVVYGIKPSRPFIQQAISVVRPHNMLPSNSYNNERINELYNNVYSTSVSQSLWNHQTLSYSNARTTPSAYGVGTSEYRPKVVENPSYLSQKSDYTPRNSEIETATNEYVPKIGVNTYPSQNSDFTQKIRGSGADSSEYGPKISGNTGYSSQNSDFTPRNSEYMTQSSEYTTKIGGTSEYTPKIGVLEYAPKFGSEYTSGRSDYRPTSEIGGASDYSSGTSNYMPQTSDYRIPKIDGKSEYTSKKCGTNSKSEYLPKIEYAPSFSWRTYNYQSPYEATNTSIYAPSVGQTKMDPIEQKTNDTSVESRLSANSGVTDLIRELKIELDDKRENDSRKIMENERIMATNTSVENDKLKQKMSKIVASPPSPLLPNPINQLMPTCKNLVHRIAEMGFPQARVARAVERLGDNETKVLEFLLQIQRLEEESGCAGERVEQALIANQYNSVESARYLKILQQLLDLGFVESKVTEALARHSNDRDKAIESLIS